MENALRLEDFLPAPVEHREEEGAKRGEQTRPHGGGVENFLAVQLEFLRAARKLRELAAESKRGDQRFESALQRLVAEATAKVARGDGLDLIASIEELRAVEERIGVALEQVAGTFGENRNFPPAAQIIEGLERNREQTRDARWQLLALRAQLEAESGPVLESVADLEKILLE